MVSQSRYSSVVWDEHLESPVVSRQISNDGTKDPAVEASSLQLSDWIKRLCHTNGDAKSLITTSDASSAWIQSVDEFKTGARKRPYFANVTMALCGPNDQARGNASDIGTHIIPITALDDLPSSALPEESYDLVVIDELKIWSDKAIETILPFLRTILDRRGFTAIRVPDADLGFAVETLQSFDGLEIHSLTEDRNFIIARPTPVSWSTDSEIFILSGKSKSDSNPVFSHLEKIFSAHNVRMVSLGLDEAVKLAGKTVISLLDLAGPLVSDWAADDFERLQHLMKSQYVLWVSPFWSQGAVENSGYGASSGILRTLRNEHWNTVIPQLLVDAEDLHDKFGLACGILQVMQLTMQESSRRPDMEYRLVNGRLLIPRILETPAVDEAMHTLLKGPRPVMEDLTADPRPLELKFQDVHNAHWEEQCIPEGELPADHTELMVEMATVFDLGRDLGKTLETALPMFEILGKVTRIGTNVRDLAVGDKVVTLVSEKSGLSTRLRVSESDTIKIPGTAHPAQAISTPLAYLTAHQILTEVGRLGSNSSLLLVGSISQVLRAMIDYAVSKNMQVIVATDSQETIEVLSSRYPALKDRILGIHGSLESSVSRLTNGCGVEASICFLGGYAGRVAARCLVQGGQFINLSRDMKLSALPENFIDSGCTFSSPRIQKTFSEKPGVLHSSVRHVFDFMDQHQILERVEAYPQFPVSDLQGAFKHCKETNGRAIVDLQAPGRVPIVLPLPELTGLSAENTYILAGGLGNLGLAFADTLVESGARHLVFLGRSGGPQHSQQLALDLLRGRGCRTDVVRCDISKKEDIDELSSEIQKQNWTVAGVIQCTTVLRVIHPSLHHCH